MENKTKLDEVTTTFRTIDRSRAIHHRIMDDLIKKKKIKPELAAKAKHYAKSAMGSAHGGANVREEYITGELFNVGDIVECNDGRIGEIIDRGPNYVTLVAEGVTFKKWLTDITPADGQMEESTDNFTFKGYTPKNFTEEHISLFSTILEHKDSYAVLNCIKAFDSLLAIDDLTESFLSYKAEFDRSVKYFTKFNLDHELLSEAEDTLLTYAILNGIHNFNVLNEAKVDNVAQAIDYHIRDMVTGSKDNIFKMRKIQKACYRNPVGKLLFNKHLKSLSPAAYNELVKGNQ